MSSWWDVFLQNAVEYCHEAIEREWFGPQQLVVRLGGGGQHRTVLTCVNIYGTYIYVYSIFCEKKTFAIE